MIGLAGEDAPADFAVGGEEEDLRRDKIIVFPVTMCAQWTIYITSRVKNRSNKCTTSLAKPCRSQRDWVGR